MGALAMTMICPTVVDITQMWVAKWGPGRPGIDGCRKLLIQRQLVDRGELAPPQRLLFLAHRSGAAWRKCLDTHELVS